MRDMNAIFARLDELETQNRRMKRVLWTLALVLSAASAIGANRNSVGVCRATRFELVDSQGNLKAELSTVIGSPRLILMHNDATATLSVSNQGFAGLTTLSKTKGVEARLEMYASGLTGTSLGMWHHGDKAGNALRLLQRNDKTHHAGIQVTDEQGNLRVYIGRRHGQWETTTP